MAGGYFKGVLEAGVMPLQVIKTHVPIEVVEIPKIRLFGVILPGDP